MSGKVMSEILTLAAGSIGDTLAAAGLDSGAYAFTLVIWPIGRPANCSTISGSGHPNGQSESTHALATASEKAKGEPYMIRIHQSQKPH